MKTCPECKDEILYCKCMEKYLDDIEKSSPPSPKPYQALRDYVLSSAEQSEIYENLKSYISETSHGTHPKVSKWKELYNIITATKSIHDCIDQVELDRQEYMKKNPLKREFGMTPSIFQGILYRTVILQRQVDYAFRIGRIKEVDKFIRNLDKNKDWCC